METAKILLPFVDKDDGPLVAKQTSPETSFLFVNETTAAPAFKHGGRQDIRSHVRKNVAKRFRQNHKTGKSVREEEGKATRYPAIAPQAIADLEYNHPAGCDHDLNLNFPRRGSEYNKGMPPARNFIKPEVFSASASSSEPPTEIELSNVDSMPPTSAKDTFYFSAAARGGARPQNNQQFFCPTCGSHISSDKRDEIERKGAMAIARRVSSRALFNSSPVESLASGRVDPFLSYPVDMATPQLHELVDHGK
jgi:hypothetical protein